MKEKPVVQSRRRLMAAAAACVSAALGSALAEQKGGLRIRTREEVGYRDEPYLGRTCSRCVLYQGEGKCVILSEPVSPTGWCTQWVPNTMGRHPTGDSVNSKG
jgi:hypothetical protein